MILKTSCVECIFACDGCMIDKPTLKEGDKQITVGLCGHKKSEDWKNNILLNYPADDLQKLSNGEYKTMTLLTTVEDGKDCLECKLSHLNTKFLFLDKHPLIKHVVVSSHQKNPDNFEVIARYLEQNCPVAWTLDSLLEEPIGQKEQLDYSARLVNTYWTVVLDRNKWLSKITLSAIDRDFLSDVSKNPVAFYFDENDYENVIYPTYAYELMEGNDETWWMQKIQTFDNWKEVCQKII